MFFIDRHPAEGTHMIARLAQFAPKPGQEESVTALLRSQLAFTAGSQGCQRAYLGAPIHGQHFLLYSEWASGGDLERHEASLRTDPQASTDFFGLLGRLSSPPTIQQFEVYRA